MRYYLLLLFVFVSFFVKSQAPQSINYQAIARDAGGNLVTTAIGIKFQIFQGSVGGTLIYEETNTATPSSAGVFNVGIGLGAPVIGTFSSIAWGSGPYFLQVSIDPAGGTSYSSVGSAQLVSVPYALFAEKAGNASSYTAGNGITISSGSITNAAPDQTVTLNAAGITTVSGTYPNYTVGVASPSLSFNNGTKELTITQGGTSSTTTLTGSGSNTISMVGTGIANVSPSGAGSNFTVNVQSPVITGQGATLVMGTWPNFTISSTSTSYSAGAGISIASGSIINTAPNQTVSITGAGSTTVTGTYPNFTIAAPLPTVTPAPNFIGQGTATITTVANNYTVNVAPVGMNFTPATGILTYSPAPGINSINISPNISFTNNILTVGSNTTTIAGTGLWSRPTATATSLANTSDYVGIGTTSPQQKLDLIGYLRIGAGNLSSDEGWLIATPSPGIALLKAGGRATTEMRVEQPNAAPMAFYTSGIDRMRISTGGSVGIGTGTNTPNGKLEIIDASSNGSSLLVTSNNTSAIDAGAAIFNSTGLRSIGNSAVIVNNLVTKAGGSGSTKIGLQVNSTGSWAPTTGQPNIGIKVSASGADNNYALQLIDGSQGLGKVLTSDAAGNSTWNYPLTPTKEGNYTSFFYLANSTNYTYNGATILTFTPAVTGTVIFHVSMNYNFDYSLPSQSFCGIHVNTTGVAPGTTTPFTASARVGRASGTTGSAYGDIPVAFTHSMSVVAGTVYYVWIGGKGVNLNQTTASIGTTKVIVTLHQSTGL